MSTAGAVASNVTAGPSAAVVDDWADDISSTLGYTPVVPLVLSSAVNRLRVTEYFRQLYQHTHADVVPVDMNIAYLEDTIVTCLGKLDPTVFPYSIRFDVKKTVKMTFQVGAASQTIEETATELPYKHFENGSVIVRTCLKNAFVRFFLLVARMFQVKSRRSIELILSPIIARVTRRQDILFNKPAKLVLGPQREYILKSQYTPLFRGSQTYRRFMPLIQNHCGIGVKLQLLLSSDLTNLPKAKARINKILIHQEQKDMLDLMSTTASVGMSLDWINLFLQSCFVFRPKEGISFIPSMFYPASTSTLILDAYNAFYKTANSVDCNGVPFWFIELLTMTGAYYDDLGVFEYMVGTSFYRRDFKFENMVVLPLRIDNIIINALKPLKGSASSHPGSSKQLNTVVSVHGKRTVKDEFKWMNININWGSHSDAYMRLRTMVETEANNQARGTVVCSFDDDIAIVAKGFWND